MCVRVQTRLRTPTTPTAARRSPWSKTCKPARGRQQFSTTAHVGDIQGAFGTIREHDLAARRSWGKKFLTLLAIVGPGLIVMVGDNDAGGVRDLCPGRSNPA